MPDGTYWFRAMTDPNNDLAEANETNNETDVKVTVAGEHGDGRPGPHPDTTPPAIIVTAPGRRRARVSGTSR